MNWRIEVLDPTTMSTQDIRDELAHDLEAYNEVRHPLSKQGMATRIATLVNEMDRRAEAPPSEASERSGT